MRRWFLICIPSCILIHISILSVLLTIVSSYKFSGISDIPSILWYKSHQISTHFSSHLAGAFAQSIEARCWVENEDVVGAVPTGGAPSTSECLTIALPNKVCIILHFLRYMLYFYVLSHPFSFLGFLFSAHVFFISFLFILTAICDMSCWCYIFLRIPSSTIVTDDYSFVFCVVVVVGLIHILSSSNWKCRYQKLWVISPVFLPSFFALPFVSYEIYLFYSTRGVLFQFISLLLLSWILSFTDCQLISFLVSSFIITSFLVLAFSDRFPWWWHFD